MSPPREPRHRFRLVLEALPSPIPEAVRLRMALRTLPRAFGLRCLGHEELPTAGRCPVKGPGRPAAVPRLPSRDKARLGKRSGPSGGHGSGEGKRMQLLGESDVKAPGAAAASASQRSHAVPTGARSRRANGWISASTASWTCCECACRRVASRRYSSRSTGLRVARVKHMLLARESGYWRRAAGRG
jgi:hypothetical protein